MALRKKKLTKKVWFQDELWKVEQVISPNKYDDFLVLSRETDETIPVEMVLIDANNQTFYPNTKRVQKLMKERNKLAKQYEETKRKHDWELTKLWCETIVDQ